MLRPAHWRWVVGGAQAAYQLSECQARRVVQRGPLPKLRYRSVKPKQEALRRRIPEFAGVRVPPGCWQIYFLLRRVGSAVNHWRDYRLYTEERLALACPGPKRRKTTLKQGGGG